MAKNSLSPRTILTIVLAVLSLPQFPVGTAFGVYALVIMFNDEAKNIFTV